MSFTLVIDQARVEVPEGTTILAAASTAGIYIPTLCWHPDIAAHPPPEPTKAIYQGKVERKASGNGSFMGCDLCVVEIEGRDGASHSCWTPVEEGMVVRTESDALRERRVVAMTTVLEEHPRACLSCRQKSGCPRDPCSLNVPPSERCCPKLGRCQIEKLFEYLEFAAPLPPYSRDERLVSKSPLFAFDWNLCVGCLRCVRACGGLREVGALGYVMANGRPRVGFTSATPDEGTCRFCGACAEICPTGTILDRELHWTERERYLVPCRDACPADLDIPGYVRAIAQGRPEEAARIVRESVPFGRSLGRICHAPCETGCRRTALGEAISICALKRFACDETEPEGLSAAPATGHKVAVVGAGPAGLAAAWFLARKGHEVTVFEEQAEAGGMLRWGIPAFRLPSEVVQEEIQEIRDLGVEIRTSTRVEDLPGLGARHDAVLLATGLPSSKRLEIPGIDGERVWHGLEFLETARSGAALAPGKSVLVIGGGNVAIDCALTARRLGAEKVTAVCLESEEEMPAFDWEVRQAKEEGVEIRNRWGPVEIRGSGGRKECEFRRCTSVFDEEGRFAPRFDDAERMVMEVEGVIAAIGQEADAALPAREDEASGIFVAGDVAGGPYSVVGAVASGKKAAAKIDRHLGGDGLLPEGAPAGEAPQAIGVVEGFASMGVVAPSAPKGQGFEEIEPGYSPGEAVREAVRCLQCDLRLGLQEAPMPPDRIALLEITEATAAGVPEKEGVLQVFGGDRELLQITGTSNLRKELQSLLSLEKARYFAFEVDPYYTKRESELLQGYLQRHGRMPEGLEAMDDLF